MESEENASNTTLKESGKTKPSSGDLHPPAPKKSSEGRGSFLFLTMLLSLVVGFMGGWLAVRNEAGMGSAIIKSQDGERIILQESELIANIAEDVGQSVVSITAEIQSGGFFGSFTQAGAGTGIILTEEGLLVTNKHVVPENPSALSIVLSDGREFDDIEVIGRDPFNDIAFLKINGASGLKTAKLGDSSVMRVGERVVAIGNALGQFENTVTSGIISGLGRPVIAGEFGDSEQLQNLFQTDTAINPGNSGGPLVNMSGEIIGINTAVAGDAENIGFAIPINDVKPGIASVQDSGRLVRPYLGVRYIAITDDVAEEFDLSVKRGAYIVSDANSSAIIGGSPAEKAGLREEDIIVKVEGDEINEKSPLVTLVSKHAVGETINLTVIRSDGNEEVVQVTLEEAPDSL